MPRETIESVAHSRAITAAAVLQQLVDLRAYPHRHLAVAAYAPGGASISQALAAADYLSHTGWELINLTEVGSSRTLHAIMRRR
ncbi:transcriptional regulator [Micromonospora taraxaci]|uniref:transcriptional regulator n=1 Tax=Micromonospora TaxID=1873 RepID=UPI002ED31F5A|nr:transcriptional regulator [Micromonospora sp. NBC_00821]